MSTRKSRLFRDCDPCAIRGYTEIAPYLSRMVNNITLEGSAIENIAPDFIVYTLLTRGGIAYIKDLNEWAWFTNSGSKKRYGILPQYVKLWSEEKRMWSGQIDLAQDKDNICIFPANTDFYPLADKIAELVESLKTVEDNISQNLNNMRTLAVAVTKDNKLADQLRALDTQRQAASTCLGVLNVQQPVGDPAQQLLTRDTAEDLLTVISLSPNAENYLADYLELKRDYREELNNCIGVTEVSEKTERRINSEMEMIENSTYAFIDLICDSINKYAKFYDVDIYAHRSHSACAEHVDTTVEEMSSGSNLSPSERIVEVEGNERDN